MKQKEALDILKMGHNVFLTGAAGSGKTYVLNQYIAFLKDGGVSVGVTASTGVAATHMQGMTIHSWAGIGIKADISSGDLTKMAKKSYLKKRFKHAKVLIIDEVSMLHHYRLDMVDRVCRAMKEDERPFGGLQVVLCGDFFQLPPISRGAEKARFVYHSDIWQDQDMDLKVCYLDEQHRQSDDELLNVLNDIRGNKVTDATLNPLRKRYKKEISGEVEPTKLYTHNSDVDRINERALDKLDGAEETYEMTSTGKQKLVEVLMKSCLAPEILRLKKDAAVMFVKNNHDKGYVNGTLGTVVDFDDFGSPVVRLRDGVEVTATPESWTIEEDGKVLAEISQIPLRLAWAITVHKSQGMSLDAAEMDLSKSFEPGMGYVALSRVRTLEGLRMLGWGERAGEVNEEVLAFDQEFKKATEDVAQWLNDLGKVMIKENQKKFFDNIKPTEKEKEAKLSTYEQTKKLVVKKMSLTEIAKERGLTTGAILTHLEKLKDTVPDLDMSYLKPEKKRLTAIKKAFAKTDDTKLAPVRAKLGKSYSYEEIQLGRLFL